MSRRPTARRRARAGPERRVRVAFRTAGGLMLAGTLPLAIDLNVEVRVLSAVLFSWLAFVAVVVGRPVRAWKSCVADEPPDGRLLAARGV